MDGEEKHPKSAKYEWSWFNYQKHLLQDIKNHINENDSPDELENVNFVIEAKAQPDGSEKIPLRVFFTRNAFWGLDYHYLCIPIAISLPTEVLDYDCLSVSGSKFRVLTLLPGHKKRDPISCRLEAVDFEPNHGKYEALSYVWGDSDAERHGISINGQTLAVTSSVFVALFYLRHKTEERRFWIDAVCIDQNNEPEKKVQLAMMRDIYKHARRIVSWLGPHFFDARHAIKYIDTMSQYVQTFIRRFGKRPSKLEDYSQHGFNMLDKKKWQRAYQIVNAEYWQRMWIVQELAVSPRLHQALKTEESKSIEDADVCVVGFSQVQTDRLFLLAKVADDLQRINTEFLSLLHENMLPHHYGYPDTISVESALIYGICNNFAREEQELFRVIERTIDLKCIRTHDRLYALAGLFPDLKVEFNYKKPGEEVLLELWRHYVDSLRTSQNKSRFLCFNHVEIEIEAHQDNFPSWIFRLEKNSITQSSFLPFELNSGTRDRSGISVDSFGGLHCKAFLRGRISFVLHCNYQRTEGEWISAICKYANTLEQEPKENLWRTLVADFCPGKDSSEDCKQEIHWSADYSQVWDFILRREVDEDAKMPDMVIDTRKFDEALDLFEERILFPNIQSFFCFVDTDNKKKFGWASRSMREGDELAVIQGIDQPIILQRNENAKFVHRGRAWIREFAWGALFKDESLTLEDIVII